MVLGRKPQEVSDVSRLTYGAAVLMCTSCCVGQCFHLSSINPHTLSFRPLVLPATSDVQIKVRAAGALARSPTSPYMLSRCRAGILSPHPHLLPCVYMSLMRLPV